METLGKRTSLSVKVSRFVALAGSVITLAQIILLVSDKKAICFNEGCALVDSLTKIDPLYINLAGFFYFQVLFWLLLVFRGGRGPLGFVNVFLLAGIAAEGVLISFQHLVVQAFCSYCLIIFSLIFLLNLLAGIAQIFRASCIFFAVLFSFAVLQFTTSGSSSLESIEKGVFASMGEMGDSQVRRYLFFSSSCRYCEEVIDLLQEGGSCGLSFNPVDTIAEFPLDRVKRYDDYSIKVNKKILGSFGLHKIPALLILGPSGFEVVTGMNAIEADIKANCSVSVQEGVQGSTLLREQSTFDFLVPVEEGCSIEQDCEDDVPDLQEFGVSQ